MSHDPDPISPAQAREMLQAGAAILVDVREAAAFTEAHPAPARSVPIGELAENAAALAAAAPLVITSCGGGTRGPKAARLLVELGVAARPLAGGLRGWRAAGFDVNGS
jgi:rhodanese-related sulfurtransferase